MPTAALALLAQLLMERFVRLWRADRRAVCTGAATGLALRAHVKADLPLEPRWNATRWAGLCTRDGSRNGRPAGARLAKASVLGRSYSLVYDVRRLWGPGVISKVLGALVELGICIHRTALPRKGDGGACAKATPVAATATGPP